ncbi:dehydrogenase [Musa troglodytarum]|uniref:Dehydrogenase n=1 Tax=Musa troglodytarum TaxID=320322 RepID=A0A9E7EDX6_9LILI|nr:dehydrogenase [Musa troglodytarum]
MASSISSLNSKAFSKSLLRLSHVETTVDRLRKSGVLRAQGLVGGNWIDAYDGMTVQVHNPATGDVITSVACIGRDEATDAISSAYTWSKLTASDRSKYDET